MRINPNIRMNDPSLQAEQAAGANGSGKVGDTANNLLKFMEDLLKSLPGGVWLTTLNASNDGSGLKVSMGAKAASSEDVARWLRTLEAPGGRFSEPVMGAISIDADGSRTFSMGAKYTPEMKK